MPNFMQKHYARLQIVSWGTSQISTVASVGLKASAFEADIDHHLERLGVA